VKHDVRLAALIVNYNTGSYAECCVRSLLKEWTRAGRAREKLEVVLVDNASPEPQEPYLSRIETLGVKVIRSSENLGYARGMNRAYAETRGGPRDVVAVLNADLHFLPGTVEVLIDYVLEHPEVGVVDPATSVDPLGVINLPPNLLPTPLEHLRITLAILHPFFARRYARFRLAKCLQWWTSQEPVASDMLSGCCLFLRRGVVEELGYVMDPRYPLYFEDTDLFRTLEQRGYQVVHHTRARILHHWSRSAKVSGPGNDEPMQRFEISRELYYRKFYGPFGRALYALTNALAKRWPKEKLGRALHPMTPLGVQHAPPVFELPRACRFLIEMSVHPAFVVSSGTFGEGKRWACPPEAWEWFFPADYYARVLDLDTREVIAAFQFHKPDPSRAEALSIDEVDALGERLLAFAPVR
jgi:GT2 family glycosyltransferase